MNRAFSPPPLVLTRLITIAVLFLAGGVLVPEGRAAPANLAVNPSFERGEHGWLGRNANLKVIRMANAPHGRRVAVINSQRGRFFTLDDRRATVRRPKARQRFVAAVSVRANRAAALRTPVALKLILRNGNGKILKTWRKRSRAARKFIRMGVRAEMPRPGRVLEVRLTVGRPAGKRISVRVDRFVVVRSGPGTAGAVGPQGDGSSNPGASAPPGSALPPERDWESLPYGRATWLYQKRSDPLPVDPNSSGMVGALLGSYASGRPAMSAAGETPTVYVSRPGDAAYTLNVTTFGKELDGRSVRLPPNAVAGSGADHPLIVLDPTTRIETRLWQASINHSTRVVTASAGGLFNYGPNGDGRPFAGAGTGSGLSYLNGLIRPEDIQRGAIDHALRFAGDFINGQHRFPATRSDQGGGDPVPMGARFYLDVTAAECDARTVPSSGPNVAGATRFLRMICHALRNHGMYAADGSGVLTFFMENDVTADWSSHGVEEALGDGNYGWIVRGQGTTVDGFGPRSATDGIPWDRFVARSQAGGGGY